MFTLIVSDRYIQWIDLPWKRGTRLISYQDLFKELLLKQEFQCLFLDEPNNPEHLKNILKFIKEQQLSISVFLAHYNGLDEDLKLSELRKEYNIEGILYAPLETNGLFTRFFLDENKTLEERIIRLFQDLGISSSQNGYHYLKSAIQWNVRLSIPNTKLKVMKLYPILAEQYDTTASNVERNMRYVIEKAFLMGNADMLEHVFQHIVNVQNGKVTNAEFIQVCTDYLNAQLG